MPRLNKTQLREQIRSLWKGLQDRMTLQYEIERATFRLEKLQRELKEAEDAQAVAGQKDPSRVASYHRTTWWHDRALKNHPADIANLQREIRDARKRMARLPRGTSDEYRAALRQTKALLDANVVLTAAEAEPPRVRCVAEMSPEQRDAELARQITRLSRYEGLLPEEREYGVRLNADVYVSVPVATLEEAHGQASLF